LKRSEPKTRWVEVQENEHGRPVDLAIVRPSTPPSSHRPTRVQFLPHHQLSPPSTRHRRRDVSDHVITGNKMAADDDARQTLLAIYQAGKPDMMFHARAPSSAALERMLAAMSRDVTPTTIKAIQRTCYHHKDTDAGHRYVWGGELGGEEDDKPVKVKVECPPWSDTVVSFRVQSRAA